MNQKNVSSEEYALSVFEKIEEVRANYPTWESGYSLDYSLAPSLDFEFLSSQLTNAGYLVIQNENLTLNIKLKEAV